MGDLVRLPVVNVPETKSLSRQMRELCAMIDNPGELRPMDILNRMQSTLDCMYEKEYERRMEQR